MKAIITMYSSLKELGNCGDLKGLQRVLKWFEFTSGWTDFLNFIYILSFFNCQEKVVEIMDPLGWVTERGAAASKGFRKWDTKLWACLPPHNLCSKCMC